MRESDTSLGHRDLLDAKSLAEATRLPAEVCRLIIRVADGGGVRGERRLEVVRELVAHFEDGLAAGRAADELLQAFGDEQVAGKLIARASRLRGAAAGKARQMQMRGDPAFYRVWRNAVYAVRRLLQSPGFTATAVISLAIGIGANTAVFSLVNAALLERPQFREPDALVDVYISRPEMAYGVFSYPDFKDLRNATSHVFSGFAGSQIGLVQADRDGAVQVHMVELVTGDYFSTLGVHMELGRPLLPEDDVAPGAHSVVVLGHPYWKSTFGGDRNVVGKQIRLAGRLYSIVGVAPRDYTGRLRGFVPAFFLPIMMVNEVQPGSSDNLAARSNNSFFVRGRLRPGVTFARASAAVSAVAAGLKEQYPSDWSADDDMFLVPTRDVILYPPIDRFVRAAAALLGIVVGLVLVLACANLAGFLLARATDRRREIALRLALGASRGTLVAQLLTETVLLGLIGGAAGLLLAVSLLKVLLAADLPLPLPIELDLSLDGRVLVFSFVMSILAGVIFGLAPALRATRPDVASTLKDETAGGGQAGRLSLRNSLVVAQVAVSLMLLVGAGLFLRSFAASQAVDPGFGREPAALLTMAVPANRYSEEEGRVLVRTLFERLQQIPGVQNVGLTTRLHLDATGWSTLTVNVDGVDAPRDREGHDIDRATVDAGFFDAASIRILRGRNFSELDREDAPYVAIVNEAMAQRFWPGEDPVGRMLRRPDGNDIQVIGVVETAKIRTLGEAPRPFVYLTYEQSYASFMTVVARTSLDAESTVMQMLAAAREVDPELWIWEAKTMEHHLAIPLLPARLSALILSAFAVLALTLCSVGLYGVVSYAVSQRTREMGIRLALGADSNAVVRMLAGSGLRLVVVGAGIGLMLALLLTRALSSLLFGVGVFDPVTFIAVPALLGGVGVLAAYIPARRASRIDPMRALRVE